MPKSKEKIDLLDKIIQDENQIEVGDAAEIFFQLFIYYFEKTNTGKIVKSKLTEDEYIAYVTGMTNTYLCSLYVNGAKDDKQQQERIMEASLANEDVLSKIEEIRRSEA